MSGKRSWMILAGLVLMSSVAQISKAQRFTEQPRPQAAPRAKAPWQLTLNKEGSFGRESRRQDPKDQPPKGGTPNEAGTPNARVVEKLPDGGFVVAINGVKYRAVTDEQLRTIQERKVKLEAAIEELALADAEIAKLKQQVDLEKLNARLATAQAEIERERAGRFEAMFNGEHSLRLQAEALAPRGRVSRIFDNPIVQIGIKLGLPFLGMVIKR